MVHTNTERFYELVWKDKSLYSGYEAYLQRTLQQVQKAAYDFAEHVKKYSTVFKAILPDLTVITPLETVHSTSDPSSALCRHSNPNHQKNNCIRWWGGRICSGIPREVPVHRTSVVSEGIYGVSCDTKKKLTNIVFEMDYAHKRMII